jgi:hypothetical protein
MALPTTGAWPRRKIWAVILSGGIMGSLTTAANVFFPEADFTQAWQHVDYFVQTGVMIAAGYVVRG